MWMDEAACLKTGLIFGHLLIPNSGYKVLVCTSIVDILSFASLMQPSSHIGNDSSPTVTLRYHQPVTEEVIVSDFSSCLIDLGSHKSYFFKSCKIQTML